MKNMLLPRLRKIKNSVQMTVQQITEYIINEALEHPWGIGESKRNDQILIMSRRRIERDLPFVPFTDPYQMTGILKISGGTSGRSGPALEVWGADVEDDCAR